MLNPSFWAGRRILITGHTGFKGSWLSLWLLQLGAEVWGYALPPDTERSLFEDLSLEQVTNRLHHQLGDVCSLQLLKQAVDRAQPEVVIHLAAQSLVRRSYKEPLATWAINVQGSLHVLEALKSLQHKCAVVMVTTDKVYENCEWVYGYRENDRLGGHDPYSASKAAAELAIASWRSSFCGPDAHQTSFLSIATTRAGNVIGGGDWAEDRIIPDVIRSLAAGKAVELRSPQASRPWQHVLEPLGGYLLLAERLASVGNSYETAYNFGPPLESNRTVRELVEAAFQYWPGVCQDLSDPAAPHEACLLHLQTDKAYHQLNWKSNWDFATTVARTVSWYRAVHDGGSAFECCLKDLEDYQREFIDAS